MRKLLLFLFGTANVNFSLLIISCDSEISQKDEKTAALNQNIDEKIIQQFIDEVKKIDFKLSEHDLPIQIQINVLNKLNAFIKKNKKYQNISVMVEKISKINKNHYIISYLPLLSEKQHIKFASTLTVTIQIAETSIQAEDQLQIQQSIETVKVEEKLDITDSLTLAEKNSNHEDCISNVEQKSNENKATTTKKVDVPVLQEQQINLASQSKDPQSFSLDYEATFKALEQEIRIKTFEYDFAQTTYGDFIETILSPWFSQKLTDLNYNLDLSNESLDEIMGNTISNFFLNITFNSDKKTKQQLLIKVKCIEKASQQAYDILESVWKELDNLQRKNTQFENLSSQPVYEDVIKRFEAKLKRKFANYQNIAFIFKGAKEKKSKTTLLQKGNNKIDFTLAIDNKSFFYLWINYSF